MYDTGYNVFNLTLDNNLVYNGYIWASADAGSNNWVMKNNFFCNCQISFDSDDGRTFTNYVNAGYNGYTTNTLQYLYLNKLYTTNSNDVILTNLTFQTAPLGHYYQPTNSPLLNVGSTNASLLGLYHYTTQTNQVKQTTNRVDIGYHYIALGTNGLPVSTSGNGLGDYLEDANGNGTVDSGEINWQDPNDLGLNVIITRPKNNSVIP
jgi:hypothetical protein